MMEGQLKVVQKQFVLTCIVHEQLVLHEKSVNLRGSSLSG